MRLLFTVVFLSPLMWATSAGGRQLSSSDIYVYAVDKDGNVQKPLKPTSPGAEGIASIFEKCPPISFARAENLYSYMPLGHEKFLVTTS